MKNDPDQFNVLRKINSNPNVSQRDLASELNLSLGKINYSLKALKSKGLVKIQNFNKSKTLKAKKQSNKRNKKNHYVIHTVLNYIYILSK